MNKEFSKLVENFKLKVLEFEEKNKVNVEIDFREDYYGDKEYKFKLVVRD